LLKTPARIFYKYEGLSPAGSHKPNTAVPQVWYNAQEGILKLTTETGAGQWGSWLAFACAVRVPAVGLSLLAQDPDHPGSLGIAISEALSEAVKHPGTRYALGSVLNHVLLHQAVIGEEALLQLARVGETPDEVLAASLRRVPHIASRSAASGRRPDEEQTTPTVNRA